MSNWRACNDGERELEKEINVAQVVGSCDAACFGKGEWVIYMSNVNKG